MQSTVNEEVWESYQKSWQLAESMAIVMYTGSLPPDTFAAFAPSLNLIILNRPDLNGHFQPVPSSDTRRMAFEASALLHELSHAESHQTGGKKYDEYLKSLMFWNYVNMDGTLLNDEERMAIFTEEMKVDTRGMQLANERFPAIQHYYAESMILNLGSYSSLLWKGEWPDGTRQSWTDSRALKQPPPIEMGRRNQTRVEQIVWKSIAGKETAGW